MLKKLVSIVATLLLASCTTGSTKEISLRKGDLTGTYTAEYTIDTVEEIALQSDDKYTFHFWLVGGKDTWYDGRWELHDGRVVLWAYNKEGREVEFPMEIDRQKGDIALTYSSDSFSREGDHAAPKCISSYIDEDTGPDDAAYAWWRG